MTDLTAALLCPHVAVWCPCLITGYPKRVMNPKPCTIRMSLWPLSNVHYAFLSGSFYVYFMIDCLHLFGTCQVFDLWLWFPVFDEHFHIDPPLRNYTCWYNSEYIPLKKKKIIKFPFAGLIPLPPPTPPTPSQPVEQGTQSDGGRWQMKFA